MRASLIALTTVVAVVGCKKEPAQIRIKVPQASYASVRMDPKLPPFERKRDTLKLRASSFYKDDSYMGTAKVKWSSSDPSVATVSLDGLVEIVSSGETMIKATTTELEKPLEATFPIKAVIIDKIEIVPPDDLGENNSLHLGETKQFTAKVYNDRGAVIEGAKVKWRCSDYAATVTMTGELEGRAIGDTQVIAEAGPALTRFNVNVLDWKKEKKKRRRRRR